MIGLESKIASSGMGLLYEAEYIQDIVSKEFSNLLYYGIGSVFLRAAAPLFCKMGIGMVNGSHVKCKGYLEITCFLWHNNKYVQSLPPCTILARRMQGQTLGR